jgi:tetraacyldisaccharide 4'-kinase
VNYSALLAPLAVLYGIAVAARNRHYDRSGNRRKASLPVVSVGNLTVGGTGKTPIVAWLAERLIETGLTPAVVSRGYGGTVGRGPRLVSHGSSAAECGDEPLLLASRLHGAVVVVGSDRHAGADRAEERGADVVLLDDGFQHRRLARDLDIVLLDGADPIGNGRLLPAGRLREPLESLRRADIIVATGCESSEAASRIEKLVRRYNGAAPTFRSRWRRAGFIDADRRAVSAPSRAVVFCGIARPERFKADIEAEGIDVVSFSSFRDHHPFSARELQELAELARSEHAALVTTEKDLARLVAADRPRPLLALRIEAEIFEEIAFLSTVTAAIESAVPFDGNAGKEREP